MPHLSHQSIKVLPGTFPLVQGLPMLVECILSSSLSNLCPPPLIYWCVLKSGYFPDIGLWVYFIELSTGGNEYIKNTDKWDISVDSGKTKQIGSSSSQESFSGNDGRQIRLFKEELGLRPNGCGRSAWRGPRKAECGSLSILTEHASPGPGSPSNRKEKSHMVKLLIEV